MSKFMFMLIIISLDSLILLMLFISYLLLNAFISLLLRLRIGLNFIC